MSAGLGATRAEWIHFAFTLGLVGNLLPCVPAPPGHTLKVAPGSKLNEGKLGKIPSALNADGLVHGLTKWQTRDINADEVDAWSQGERYNICVRTGKQSGIFAFDLDISDPSAITAALTLLSGCCPTIAASAARRTRPNASKLLIPFSMDLPCSKRIIDTAHGRIELLGDGQQFVAAGTHSSGVRYEWVPGLPSDFPRLSLPQLDSLWAAMSASLSIPKKTKSPTPTPETGKTGAPTDDALRTEISDSEWTDLLDALRALFEFSGGNDEWSEVGYALLSLQHSRPARQLWIDFSDRAAGAEPGAAEAWWAAHVGAVPRSDYRHIFRLARAQGWRPRASADIFAPVPESGAGDVHEVPGDIQVSVLPPEPDRPVLRVAGGNLPGLIERCTDLLVPELFCNAGSLVKVAASPAAEGQDVRPGVFQPVLMRSITPAWLAWRLTQLATWQKLDVRSVEWRDINCPDDIADKFHHMGEWPRIRPLEAIVSAPFMREDGSICEKPGYDSLARAIYVPNEPFPEVPAAPSVQECHAALDVLTAPFAEFPFAEPAFKSAFLAHILSEAARLAIDLCPMFWYTAPDAGTGKSLLSDMACLIVHGHAPARRPWPKEEDEMRKQLFAAMLSGERSLIFDNIQRGHKLRDRSLCAVLTSEWWEDRVLGKSMSCRVRNLMVLTATGNNITPVSDMARRSLVVRLVNDAPDMKARRFTIADLRAHVLEHRAELLVAALTILRGYQLHGAERTYPVTLPSFERWSRHVRNPLLWLGLPDPVETQELETDDETGTLGDTFKILATTYAAGSFTAGDISKMAGIDEALNAALMSAGCKEPYSPTAVGYWLRDNRDVVDAGMRLVQRKRDSHRKVNTWQLLPITRSLL